MMFCIQEKGYDHYRSYVLWLVGNNITIDYHRDFFNWSDKVVLDDDWFSISGLIFLLPALCMIIHYYYYSDWFKLKMENNFVDYIRLRYVMCSWDTLNNEYISGKYDDR